MSPLAAQVLALLQEHGPMTVYEMSARLRGEAVTRISASLIPRKGRFYVCAWRRGKSGQWCAVIAAGNGQDAPKPMSTAATKEQAKARRKPQRFPSVWAWAQTFTKQRISR